MNASSIPLPKISIVTPSYNQGQYIEETIRSVVLQGYPNLEYVIMDGGSRDTTVEVIKKYAHRITYWESEKDRGQSHAINKGLAHCTGEIFNWINSDDFLMPGALWAVAEAWMKKPGQIISGHTEFFNEAGTLGIIKATGQTIRNFVRFWEVDELGWTQPATFIPLKELQRVGGIREDLKYCMDYHMMVQLLARKVEVSYVDRVMAKFRIHTASKTVGAAEEFRLERVPTLRSMKDLPIKVEGWEWDAEQARRLADVARRAWARGGYGHAIRYLGSAFATSPRALAGELFRKAMTKVRLRPA